MKRMRNAIVASVGVVVMSAIIVPQPVWAQATRKGAAAPKLATEVEEITVVAQKREENIQETPLSVTALTGAALEERGVTDVYGITDVAPNVRVNSVGGNMHVGMRGVTQANPNTSLQPVVGFYLDGAYIAKITGSDIDLEDIERVEVLRGPQGTLYGRNTIAGAINFITNKPTEERSITAKSEVGNYNYFKGRATVNLPLIGKNGFVQSDALGTISLRETVAYTSHDGYVTNQSPTTVRATGDSDYDAVNRVFTMTSLRWQPITPLTIDYSFEYHRYRNNVSAQQLTYIYPGSPVSAGKFFDLTPYLRKNRVDSLGNNAICRYSPGLRCDTRRAVDNNHRLHILSAAYDLGDLGALGSVNLKSIASYRSYLFEQNPDIDGSPLHVADFFAVTDTQHWSEELQWVGTAPRLDYVLGAYYYGEYSRLTSDQVFFGGASASSFKLFSKTKSYATYGQATYTPPILSDKLSFTAGIRYTQEQVHADKFNRDPVRPTSAANWSASHGKAFGGTDGISPMGNIAYQWTDNLMTYFRVARGFKGGGFNGTAATPNAFAVPFDPEKLLQYELGFKSQWFDNRLRLNADGYYSDYTDLQQSVFHASPEFGALSVVGNVDSAEIWGSEVEVTAVPVRGVELTATYGLTLPKYLKWFDQKFDAQNRPIFDPEGNPVLENVASQRSFALTPEHQATVGVSYTAPATASGTFSARLDTYWQDKIVFITNNTTAGAQADEAPNYAVVNGRLQFAGIPLQKGTLDLAIFGANLFDKKYRRMGIDFGPTFGYAVNTYGFPRTFGLQLTYNLNAS